MALRALIESINVDFEIEDKSASELFDFIETYAQKEQEAYQKNKKNKALTFGRWKGFTIKELSVSDKGKSYLEWLLAQQWCSEDKFEFIHEECKALGIKKKPLKRAILT
jgi:hypothetical protein